MSIQERIYNNLRRSIIYGELGAGERLSEVELSKKMQASRTPIREAIKRLQMEGLVTAASKKGAYVSKLPIEEAEEIYDVISLLEGYAAELAAKRINSLALGELKKLQKELISLGMKRKYRDYIEKNTEFHFLISSISGNKNLGKIIADARMRIFRYRAVVTIPGYLDTYASQHAKIIDAISKKDSVRARKYMKEHINFVKNALITFLEENVGM